MRGFFNPTGLYKPEDGGCPMSKFYLFFNLLRKQTGIFFSKKLAQSKKAPYFCIRFDAGAGVVCLIRSGKQPPWRTRGEASEKKL